MKCQNVGCQIETDYLICEITGQEKSMHYCMNHTLIDLDVIVKTLKETKALNKPCECCEKQESFTINYGTDGAIQLCLDDLLAFIELRLSPDKFQKLYKNHPTQHMLHDDFYDEMTGEALQPRHIL